MQNLYFWVVWMFEGISYPTWRESSRAPPSCCCSSVWQTSSCSFLHDKLISSLTRCFSPLQGVCVWMCVSHTSSCSNVSMHSIMMSAIILITEKPTSDLNISVLHRKGVYYTHPHPHPHTHTQIFLSKFNFSQTWTLCDTNPHKPEHTHTHTHKLLQKKGTKALW